jgi:hypothetical protein
MTEILLIAIGITAYNAADIIMRGVDSTLAKTWRPIVIVRPQMCKSNI